MNNFEKLSKSFFSFLGLKPERIQHGDFKTTIGKIEVKYINSDSEYYKKGNIPRVVFNSGSLGADYLFIGVRSNGNLNCYLFRETDYLELISQVSFCAKFKRWQISLKKLITKRNILPEITAIDFRTFPKF